MHCSSMSVSLTKAFPNKALYTVFSIVGFFETDTGEKPVVGLKAVSPFFFLPTTLFSLHSFGFRREREPITGVIPVQTSLRIHGAGAG